MFIEFLLIQLFRLNVEAYYLQNFASPSSSNDEGWLIKNPYNGASVHTYDCGGNTILGGYQIFGCYLSTKTSLMKYFRLPPHYKVRVDITFWKIDDWQANVQKFYIIIDQWTQTWQFANNAGSDQCGGSGTDFSALQYNDFSLHTLNSIIVEFYSDCDSTNFWGLTNFQITLNECYLGCLFCFDSTVDCIMWKLWQSFFQLQYLDDGLEGWNKNKFPSFSDTINDIQLKMLILHQTDSAITYLTLPDHSSLIIQFRVEYYTALPIIVRVFIDDVYQYGLMNYKKEVDFRTTTIQNSKNAIKLEIYCEDGTVGIREVQIILRGPINLISCLDDNLVPFDVSCLEGCVFCVKGECLMCDTRWDYDSVNQTCESLCGDKYITTNEQCDDGNDIPFDGCHQCNFSCPLNCQNCIFGKCQTCNSGYYYSNGICNSNYDNLLTLSISQVDQNQQPNYLVEIDVAVCGDGKVQQDEECDDGNNFSNDGCYNCYFQCISSCQKCIFNKCLQCSPTYELINGKCYEKQTQFRSVSCNRLDSLASDNLIQELSQFTCCDTADTQYYNICDLERSRIKYNDQIIDLRCPFNCEICQLGQCKQCLANYFLLKNQCISQITKGVLVEDGIHIGQTEIGCYKCKDSCQVQCLQCIDSYCLLCIDGWSLVNGICKYICGDNQIAIWSVEQCDTNLDYCMDCQFVCSENCSYCINFQDCLVCTLPYILVNQECQLPCITGCKQCSNGICYDNCPNGELNIDGICYSICGDGIVQQKEQCDDGNDIQFDGCFKCQYSCSRYCENCFEGVCYQCQQFFKLIQNECYDDCGSGIKSYDEQCDDGNLINVDGCSSNCQIEIDYKCQEQAYSYSDCQYAESPYMFVKFLNQTYDKYFFEISFSQAIFFKDNYDLESLFEFSIDEISDEDYQIKLESYFEPVINKILNFQFQVQIELFVSTNSSSLTFFNLFLINEAYNSDEMEILNPSEKVSLKKYSKLSQSDIEKTKQLTQYQEAMIMAQGIGSVIVLISGNFQIFVEILDNLQYQSYLKYINVIYPENLYLFFEATNLISIVPILDYLQFNGFYQRFLFYEFIESYAKLQFYNLNAHLITNLQFFFIQVISTFIFVMILRLISKLTFRIVYRIQSQHYLIFRLRSLQSKLLIQIFNWIFNFFHYILTFLAEFYQNGVLDVLLANAWDLLFKIFLSLTSSSKQDIISRIQNIISYLVLAASGGFITSSLKPVFSRKNQMLINRYRAVYLLKQFLFCYFLICFQNHQLIQILMLTTTNIIYLIVLIFAKLNLQALDKLQMIIMEISIITFTFSTIFYLKDYSDLISEQDKIVLGFAQIYLLISGLLGIFIKQVIMMYKQIKKRCFKIKQRKKISKQVTHLIFEVVS
ncbi:unnamed protein product (macronuclear) [Paramecium tetraurelia]|uniref:TNFR-Cys domain-containing protein n=1 Tax=Paramecium tetraurelia TaxID=5888 RepID=A0BN37_PARTE|nr:uncharacterized protein GSPATT00030592001 [Paramecium tetraurelia]CAK59954.1 unnamed protein product [Paramecium tetraurelia]|eukprot:XP_001427352.1 hypothetical protein (macronuclear) [Paramecium tetraurelia strain d4-2]